MNKIKVSVLFGEQAVNDYNWKDNDQSTEEWLSENPDAIIEEFEFNTQAEYEAFCRGINSMDGHYASQILAPVYSRGEIICTICGGTNVALEGVVNPNTKEVLDYVDGAFNDGRCDICGWVILSPVDMTSMEIEGKYQQFMDEHDGQEPTILHCEVASSEKGPEDINKVRDEVIRITNGLDGLKALLRPNDRGFVVVDIYYFE